ncbi:WG repeat-containing protein [Bordetella sp. BOR01]|uniref:WG repeat-containing protein n=1 Tax=Bordetella sp. BOR01 TaxID=2854779 RepID=UPI001C43CE8F|nr:WG repeat-containing protein [Bordetella sp. BOR01]MBV7483462.1 WG repeat-containing protein [Bordetella sp. BOR01]
MKKLSAICTFALLAIAAGPALAQDYDRHGHALVQDERGWVYIDRAGHSVLRPYLFDNGPDYFEEGLARFVQDGKIGFHDEALNIVIPAKYEFAFPFQDGAAKTGSNCRFVREGEHSSVYCQAWQYIDHRGGLREPQP